jgi:hypothetical protein
MTEGKEKLCVHDMCFYFPPHLKLNQHKIKIHQPWESHEPAGSFSACVGCIWLDGMKQQLQQQSSTKFILPALLTA